MQTILIIEDCGALRHGIVRMLQQAGYATLEAPSGKEAISLLEKGGVDALVTDLYMPDVDGLEVLRFLRKSAVSVPAIAISANQLSFDALKTARILGAVDSLRKPLSSSQLLSAVAQALVKTTARGDYCI